MSSQFDPLQPKKELPELDVTRFTSADDHDDDFELSSDTPAESPVLVGVLGDYLLLEPIGAGGMGQVYRAQHRTMNRDVAIKVLNKSIAERQDLLEQFFIEIRAVAKLMHPNIVTAFDAGTDGTTHYLVMELVDGEILSSRIRRNGPLDAAEAVDILEQATQALDYAHRQGIIHRDIKPSNMMLTSEGTLKILDFGLAQLGVKEPQDQQQHMFLGTPEYMSPEQIENPDHVDGRSDLYSLGASLYFMLTGNPMFAGEQMQVARAQIQQKPTPLFVARPDIDLRLDAVFQKLVAKNPEDRYNNALDLLGSLQKSNLTSQTATGSALTKGAYRLGSDAPTSVAYDKSTLAKKSQILAIDLGLLASTAAHYDADLGPRIISQGEGNAQHMRNMLWSSGEQIKVGTEAAKLRQVEPDRVFHSVQRKIGTPLLDRSFAGKTPPPEVMVAALLRQLVRNSASAVDNSNCAVVTVPSCYDQLHRRAIRNACQIAGIELVQLLDKTMAGALSWFDVNYRLANRSSQADIADSKLLVVHLGGSGLEASVIQVQGMTLKQLGGCGHWKLGTQRWQHLLTEYFASTLMEKTGKSIREDVAGATRLQRSVELAMDRLTRARKVELKFDWMEASIQQTITQDGLVKIAPDLTSGLQQSISSACTTAKTDLGDIDHVLLAGSMMKMQPIAKIVLGMLPSDLKQTMLEKSDFARGAAIYAHQFGGLSSSSEIAPRVVNSTAYDIALLAGSDSAAKPRILLEKATTIPASVSRTLRPQLSNGRSSFPDLQLIESSSLGNNHWLKLGAVKPAQVFPERHSDDPLKLRLEVDDNGILETSLLWPNGNRQIAVPASSEPELTNDDLHSWKEWLETVFLCSNS